jgi:hypothetical protein
MPISKSTAPPSWVHSNALCERRSPKIAESACERINSARIGLRIPLLPYDETEVDDADSPIEDHGKLRFALGTKGRSRFRSRSVSRFPC